MTGVLRALVMTGVRAKGWTPSKAGIPHDLDRPVYFPDRNALLRCFAEIRSAEWGTSATISAGQQSTPQFQSATEFLDGTPAPITHLSFLGGQFNVHLKNSGQASTSPDAMNDEYYTSLSQLTEVVCKHTKPMPYWRLLVHRPHPAVLDMDADAAGKHRRQKSLTWITVLGGLATAVVTFVIQRVAG